MAVDHAKSSPGWQAPIQRIWMPAALFAVFLTLALFSDNLLGEIGSSALAHTRRLFIYAVQIGIWLTGAAVIVQLANLLLWDRLVARLMGRQVPRLLKDFLAAIVYLIALAGIVGIVFEQSMTGIWATSSVLGLVLGLALRSVILDVFTGLAVNLDRSFQIGDFIELRARDVGDRIYGQVIDIKWRATRIQLDNGSVIVMPNSMAGAVAVVNFSTSDNLLRRELAITLDFSVPTFRAIRVLLGAAKAAMQTPGLLETPEPSVLVKEASPLGTVYLVRYYADVSKISPPVATHAVTRSLLDHLAKAGITPAYPKEDHFQKPMPIRVLDYRTQADRIELLRGIHLFGDNLIDQEFDELARLIRQRTFRMGETLIRQGEPGHSMFILAEGLVHVLVEVGEIADVPAEARRVAQIEPGQVFGEMSLLTGEPRTATIRAASDVIAFEIGHDHIATLLKARPDLAEQLSKSVAERRVRTLEALRDASEEERGVETVRLSQQILAKMKGFFQTVFGGRPPRAKAGD
jgi:small-conductance mechanosensitive channel/CRP-like cAMP-binding protein